MKFPWVSCLVWATVAAAHCEALPHIDNPASTSTARVAVSTQPPIVLPEIFNNAFCEGEKLVFAIKYEFVTGGTAIMEVKGGPLIDGRPSLQIETSASSNSFIDKFFKVRDFNASTVDKLSLFSRNFHQNLKEGGYKVVRNTLIEYSSHSYKFERVKNDHKTERTGAINQPVHDILSAFFFTRTLNLKPGHDEEITVFSDEDIYQLVVKVYPKLETITVAAGKFECLRIEPMVKGDAIFNSSGNKMVIWLTNDEKKIPVLIRSKVFIGAFDAELQQFRPESSAKF